MNLRINISLSECSDGTVRCMVRSLCFIKGKCGLETQWDELIQCMLMQVMSKGESEKEIRSGLADTLMANDW